MVHEGELWQEFDKSGEPLMNGGRLPSLGNPKVGESVYSSVAIVWLFRKTESGIEVLFQKRSEKVDRFPGTWDIAAGGHINYGESVIDAAIREAREEIGVEIDKTMLSLAIVTPSLFANNILREFICDYTGRPDNFHFDDEEVSEVKWVPLEEFDDFIIKNAKTPLVEDVEIRSIVKQRILSHGDN
ncbi:NUDIX domain-containing protein [Candidatus Saccharibacteria bacterium]|nr:NUDIX domain-containing protein [Candidatus Saccharibacteria bacterium]